MSNQSIIVRIKKSIENCDIPYNHKTPLAPNVPFTAIDMNDFETTYEKWAGFVQANKKRWHNNSEFLLFFFGGQLDIKLTMKNRTFTAEDPGYLNHRASDIITWRTPGPAKNLVKKLEVSKTHKLYSGFSITYGETVLDLIYLANVRVIEELEISRNALYKNLITEFKQESFTEPLKMASEKDVAKLLTGFLLLFLGMPISKVEASIKGIHENISDILCQDFESTLFNESILPQKGLLGVAGSLTLLYHGLNFVTNKKAPIDVNTLTTCCDIFYYEAVNNSIEDNLGKAYICAAEAYKRGEHTVSAYNLGYYHYVYAVTMDQLERGIIKNTDPVWLEFKNLMQNRRVQNPGLMTAIKYFTEACGNGHASSYTSLGNMCTNGSSLPEEAKKALIRFAKKTNKDDFKSVHFMKTNRSDLEKASFIFYKTASMKGCLNGTYNCMRLLEKLIIEKEHNDVKPESNDKSGLYRIFCKCLKILKDYKHPQGTNIYCLYLLWDLYKDKSAVNEGRISTADKAFIKNHIINPDRDPKGYSDRVSDFVPRLYLDGKNADIRREIIHKYLVSAPDQSKPKTAQNDSYLNDKLKGFNYILELLRYVSGYTYNQLCYFWPIYHYCYLIYKQYENHREASLPEKQTDLRMLLEKIISDTATMKDPSLSVVDYQKAYSLLIRIATLNDDNFSEMSYVYLKYRDKIDAYLSGDDDSEIKVGLMNNLDYLTGLFNIKMKQYLADHNTTRISLINEYANDSIMPEQIKKLNQNTKKRETDISIPRSKGKS